MWGLFNKKTSKNMSFYPLIKNQRNIKNSQKIESQWQLDSQIFYLLNTLKIYSETAFGKITLEDIDKEKLSSYLDKVALLSSSETLKTSPVILTVCGVTVETAKQKTRIRAIPKAAGIRFFMNGSLPSDAYFYKGDKVRLDCLPGDLFTDRLAKDAHSLQHLDLTTFIQLLEKNNAKLGMKIPYLRAENFVEPLTLHEQQAVESLTERLQLIIAG